MTSRLKSLYLFLEPYIARVSVTRAMSLVQRTSLGTRVLIVAFLNDSTTQLVTVLLLLKVRDEAHDLDKEEALSRTDTLPLS